MRRSQQCLAACLAWLSISVHAGPLDDYEPVVNALAVAAPAPAINVDDPDVKRGRYLVNLLGCASCHTDGALLGAPSAERALAGSGIGIAISDPMLNRYPAVIYPPNITPHPEAGIGKWTVDEITRLIRDGTSQHGGRALPVMPWQNYAQLTEEDALAIARYLKSIPASAYRVPERIPEGKPAQAPYIHVGLYQKQ